MRPIHKLFNCKPDNAKSNLAPTELPETPTFPEFEESNPTQTPTIQGPEIDLSTVFSIPNSPDLQPSIPSVQSTKKTKPKPPKPPKKIGRPSIPAAEKRTYRVFACLNQSEYNEVISTIPNTIPLSEFVRSLLLNHIRTFNQFRK